MKKYFFLFLFFIFCLSFNIYAQRYDSYIVKVKAGFEPVFNSMSHNAKVEPVKLINESLSKNARNMTMSAKARTAIDEIRRISIIESKNIDFINQLYASGIIERIEPNIIYRIEDLKNETNDPMLSSQWPLEQINAFKAWEKATGKGIIIGVVDSGIDREHPDLAPNLWVNSGEDLNKNGKLDYPQDFNNRDDDNNGYVDDIIGFDFVDQTVKNFGDASNPDGLPDDENGHGTNVSGVIAAVRNNQTGIAGLAFNAKIMTARGIDATGDGEADDLAAGIIYCALNGAKVINLSFGDTIISPVLQDAAAFANEMGCVVTASAGNKNVYTPHYPSGHSPIISCAGSAKDFKRYSASNYGSFIDLAAPAADVPTTAPLGRYATKSGTSFAAPYVAAAAALLLEQDPSLTPLQVRGALIASAQDLGKQGWDTLFGAGILDVNAALELIGKTEIALYEPANEILINRDKVRQVAVIGKVTTPLFESYRLDIGSGRLPNLWNPISEIKYKQVIKDTLSVLDLSSFEPGVYTLRLYVTLRNVNSIEKRITFEIITSNKGITFENLDVINAYYDDVRNVLISANTSRSSRFYVQYRPKASNEPWRTVNNYEQAIRHHFVRIGKEAEAGVEMEARAVAIVEQGDTAVKEFSFTRQAESFTSSGFIEKNYSIPRSYLLNETADFYGGNPAIVVNDMRDIAIEKPYSYEFRNSQFVLRDSLKSNDIKVIADLGETNGDGKPEVLFSFISQSHGAYLTQSSSQSSSPFSSVLYETPWEYDLPSEFLYDMDKDGRDEIIGRTDSSYYLIDFENGSYNLKAQTNMSDKHKRMGVEQGSAAGDFDNDGKIELAFTNQYGFVFIYEYSNGAFNEEKVFETDVALSNTYMTRIDIEGDGIPEILTSTHTSKIFSGNERFGAPVWLHRLIKSNSTGQYDIIWTDYSFGFRVGPTSNANVTYRNGISSGNVDGQPGDEAIMLTFPNTYVMKWNSSQNKFEPFWYFPLTLSNSAIVYDFDKNGKNEIGISTFGNTAFFEYSDNPAAPAIPAGLEGWALSSTTAYLKWNKTESASTYKVYEIRQVGNQLQAFEIAAVTEPEATLSGLQPNKLYSFVIKSFNLNMNPSESDFSDPISIQLHPIVEPLSLSHVKAQALEVHFSGELPYHTVGAGYFELMTQAGAIKPFSATIAADTIAILMFADSIPEGLNRLSIGSFRDRFNSPTISDTLEIFVDYPEPEIELYLESLEFIGITGRSLLQVHLSEPVDSSAENPYYWEIEPFGHVMNVEISEHDSSIVLINLSSSLRDGARGKNFTITALPQIRALSGRNMTEGPGNTLGFVFSASNLEEPYVYPSPVKLSELTEVVFANITAKAEITIMEMNGKLINRVTERDANGGAVWNGKDVNGDFVKPGVYLYRVTGTNAEGKEFESELNKFMVVP